MWHIIFGPPKIEKLKAQRNIGGLTRALFYTHHFGISYAAAEALGEVGDETAVEPLVRALQLPDVHLRVLVAHALGRIGDKAAVEPLIAALNSPHRRVLAERIVEIRQGEQPVADLLEAVVPDLQADPALRLAAAETFMQDDERQNDDAARREAAGMFLNSLVKEHPRIRKHAAGMLRGLVKGMEEEALRRRAVLRHEAAIREENTAVRAAAHALGELGDPRARQPLQELLADPDEQVVRDAAYALNQLGR